MALQVRALTPRRSTGIFISYNGDGNEASHSLREDLAQGFADRYFPGETVKASGSKDSAERARQVAGSYVPSRVPWASFAAAWVPALFPATIEHTGDGGLKDGETQLVEVEPWVWRQVDGRSAIAAQVEDGKVVSLSQGPALTLLPMTPVQQALAPVFGVCLILLLVVTVAWPIGALRRRRALKRGQEVGAPVPWLTRVARGGGAMALAAQLTWILVLAVFATIQSSIVGYGALAWVAPVIRGAQVLQALGVVAVIPAAADLVIALRRRAGWRRVTMSAVLLAALVALAWWAWAGNAWYSGSDCDRRTLRSVSVDDNAAMSLSGPTSALPIRRNDVLLALVFAVVQPTVLLLASASVPAGPWPWFAATAAPLAAEGLALVLWRSRPLLCQTLVWSAEVATSLLLPAGYVASGYGQLVVSFGMGMRFSLRRTVIFLTALSLAYSAVDNWRDPPEQWQLAMTRVLVTLAACLLPLLGGAALASSRRYEHSRQELLRREHGRQLEVALIQERRRLAGELHDVAAHHLAGIVVQAAALERLIDRDPQTAREAVQQLRRQAKETLSGLRSVVGLLRSDKEAEESSPGCATCPSWSPPPGRSASISSCSTVESSAVGPMRRMSAMR